MKKLSMFLYSIIAYLIGFVSLLFWILSGSGLIPEISIDRHQEVSFPLALITNLVLVLVFAVPHSVMARKWFKEWITKIIPRPIERSTYVLVSGLTLSLLSWRWEAMGGSVWSISAGTPLFYGMYVLSFFGWVVLFISTFLINHFDLFGLRQTYLELTGKTYQPLNFKVVAFYKIIRHPIYFGGTLGVWATPNMTMTHFVFAILLTAYFVIGALFEENDLIKEFGEQYTAYKKQTPMMVPFFKRVKQ